MARHLSPPPDDLLAAPRLRSLTAPFSHRRLLLEWLVEPKAAFPAGTPLYALRHAGGDAQPLLLEILLYGLTLGLVRRSGIGREHSEASSEAGIIVWQAPGGWRSITAGEQLGSWVSLREWQAFSALLGRHEQFIRSKRAVGRVASGQATTPEASVSERRDRQQLLSALRREREALQQELAVMAPPALRGDPALPTPSASEEAPAATADDLPELLEAIGDPAPAVLAAYARAGGSPLLLKLEKALTAAAATGSPLPLDDLLLIRADASLVVDFAAHLEAFDELLAATLADPQLDERERHKRLQTWCNLRAQLLDQV